MLEHLQAWLHVFAIIFPSPQGFCPQGFGQASYFPPEWKIPLWPQDMSMEKAALLTTVALGGFKNSKLNEEYLQGPGLEFFMQGRETFWQASGKYFMYYCQRFRKWRIAEISAFGQNMDGNCFAFVTDGAPGRDILNKTLLKGFAEVQDGKWVMLDDAGVVHVGKLGDQIEEADAADDDLGSDSTDCNNEAGVGESGESPFGEEKDKSKCPVMPAVRAAKKKIVQVGKAAGNWVRRLFPKYLGAPDEEDAIPDVEDNPLFEESKPEVVETEGQPNVASSGSGGSCDTGSLVGCSFKEQFYIEKQKNTTAEKRVSELNRLGNMQNVVMKPEQKDWLASRITILYQLVSKDKVEL